MYCTIIIIVGLYEVWIEADLAVWVFAEDVGEASEAGDLQKKYFDVICDW